MCPLYTYGMFELAKNLNDQNCVNSKANCVHYMYRMSGCKEQEKFNRKLCTLYTYGMSALAQKLNVQNCVNSTGKCTLNVWNV